MLKHITAPLRGYWLFVKRHPLPGGALSLLLAAACAGTVYLVVLRAPAFFH